MSVVEFPQEERVWQCGCGSQLFYITTMGGFYAACENCDTRHPLELVLSQEASNDGN
jgi:hypothetical protein